MSILQKLPLSKSSRCYTRRRRVIACGRGNVRSWSSLSWLLGRCLLTALWWLSI